MARKTRQGSPVEAVVYFGMFFLPLVLAVLATSAVYLPPLVAALAWLYFEIRARGAGHPTSASDFEPSGAKANHFRKLQSEATKLGGQLSRIEAEGAGLPVNANGDWDRRNPLGRTLMAEWDELYPEYEEVTEGLREIGRRTLHRFHRWARYRAGALAFRIVLLAYAAIIVGLYELRPAWLLEITANAVHYVVVRITAADPVLYGASLVATACCAALLPITWRLARSHAEGGLPGTATFLARWGKVAEHGDIGIGESEDDQPLAFDQDTATVRNWYLITGDAAGAAVALALCLWASAEGFFTTALPSLFLALTLYALWSLYLEIRGVQIGGDMVAYPVRLGVGTGVFPLFRRTVRLAEIQQATSAVNRGSRIVYLAAASTPAKLLFDTKGGRDQFLALLAEAAEHVQIYRWT